MMKRARMVLSFQSLPELLDSRMSSDLSAIVHGAFFAT